MKYKKIATMTLGSIMALSFAGCATGSSDGGTDTSEVTESESTDTAESTDTDTEESTGEVESFKVGTIGPLTGPYAQYGTQALNGITQSLDESGVDYEIVSYDDQGDPSEGTNLYQRLVNNDEVDVIIGAVTSGSTSAVASASQADGIPVITPTATQDDITLLGDNIFRACFRDSFQGEVLAKFAYEELGVTTAAVVYNNSSDYSTGLNESFANTFTELGGEILVQESYSDTDVDYKTQLNKVAASDAEVLFLPDYYETIALMAKQINDLGMDQTLLGADGWDGVLNVVDDASILDGSYIVNNFSVEDETPIVQDFISNYKDLYGEDPTSFSASGYDAGQIVLDAIERAGSTDYDAVIDALNTTDINSVGGNIIFDENGDPIKGALVLELMDGETSIVTKME